MVSGLCLGDCRQRFASWIIDSLRHRVNWRELACIALPSRRGNSLVIDKQGKCSVIDTQALVRIVISDGRMWGDNKSVHVETRWPTKKETKWRLRFSSFDCRDCCLRSRMSEQLDKGELQVVEGCIYCQVQWTVAVQEKTNVFVIDLPRVHVT